MSRRNAEAGAHAAVTRARGRLSASLNAPAGARAGASGGGEGAANALPGLRAGGGGLLDGSTVLNPGAGTPSGQFVYGGGRGHQGGSGSAGGENDGVGESGAGAGTPRFRWRTGTRVAVLLGVVSVLLGAWFWWRVAVSAPTVVPLGDVSSAAGEAAAAGGSTEAPPGASPGAGASGGATAGKIVVHVAGAVGRAGVVELPPGSRIHEAITAAGGSTAAADLNRLNLAAVLEDGQKIYVPQAGEGTPEGAPIDDGGAAGSGTASGGAGSGAGGTSGAAGTKVDLNTASVEELGTLPRVGPVLAQRIVAWRKEHGKFKTIQELDAVDGVGPKMLETLLPLVKV